jgi:hypothetical protein
MPELVLDYRANPGAMGASVGVVYLNESGQLSLTLNDGVERVIDSDKVDSAAVGYSFGYKRNTTAALNVGYYGGVISVAGVKTIIADGTVALTDATTNYVERTAAGVVSKNTVGYTAGQIPMFRAVTAAGVVTGITDDRQSNVVGDSLVVGNEEVSGNLVVRGTINTGTVNDIGTPGARGFGLGICPAPPPGMMGMLGFSDQASDNYGNYQYSDGSIMCWIPAIYYKFGTGANGLAINAVDIKPLSAYANEGAANAAGYALHRADYDNGVAQLGEFVDKYLCSKNGTIASSIRFGAPLSSNAAHNQFADLAGAPANFYYGAIAAAKTRGPSFFCNSRFIFAKLALLAYAHAQASTATTYCAWYDATYNTPKGCNNNALGDDRDASILYLTDGYSNAGKTGSANYFARTTHNGQNSGVADLNGCMWEITPGLATNGAGDTYYVLKTSAQMKAVTGDAAGATDLWGAAGLAALYDSFGATYGAALASDTTKLYGAATQVFSEAVNGAAWAWAGLGAPLAAGVGGTNAFGSDGFWDYQPADMCPISGGGWGNSSSAGVWALNLANVRGGSGAYVGFRAALYL